MHDENLPVSDYKIFDPSTTVRESSLIGGQPGFFCNIKYETQLAAAAGAC
jgi:hypothetical protein